jgi:predicted transposase YdaD
VDETHRDRHSDIVYRTKTRGQVAFLYILFEHQSTPDFWMIFRLLCYMTNLWREYIE